MKEYLYPPTLLKAEARLQESNTTQTLQSNSYIEHTVALDIV